MILEVDGVGMQAHVSPNYYPTKDQLAAVIARLASQKIEAQLTELDVNMSSVAEENREPLQELIYRGIAAACQSQPGCTRITTWGFTDRFTFQGSAAEPLPFDTEYQPKAAWSALAEELSL